MERINIIENLVQAVSILNKTDEYLEGLTVNLSECDSLISDYEHFIENTPIETVNLEKLYQDMQNIFIERRNVKNDLTLRDNYKKLATRLNNLNNREFLIQDMKNAQSRLGIKYHNRILTVEQVDSLKTKDISTKKKRGRPKKEEEVV